MRFLRSLADFLSALAFLCCHAWLLALTIYMCTSIHINFWCIVKFRTFLISVAFKSILKKLTGKKYSKVKLQRFRKVWIWTFGWLIHQTNPVCEDPKLKQNFRKGKVVTGKTSSHKSMPISQTEGYFKNPILKEPMLFQLVLKWNLYKKAFSCVKTKTSICRKLCWKKQPFISF